MNPKWVEAGPRPLFCNRKGIESITISVLLLLPPPLFAWVSEISAKFHTSRSLLSSFSSQENQPVLADVPNVWREGKERE